LASGGLKYPPMSSYDAIVVGTGQAGPALAARLAGAGRKVAVIERGAFGGTCVNDGCTPTKTLIASAYAAHMARRAGEYGVLVQGAPRVDMKRVKARKDDIVRSSREGVEKWMQGLKGATVYRTIVFLSYPLMAVAVGIIWRWMYDERGGIINYALRASGLVDRPIGFLQDFDWALPSVIFAEIWQVLGFYMIILLTGLQSIPQNLYEAARIDGAPAWARFFRITVPMLRPSLFLCIVVGILNSFSSFDLVYIMTNGGPGHATELLITHIYKSAFVETKFDYAAALTVVQFALLVVLTIAANRAAGGNAGAVERD